MEVTPAPAWAALGREFERIAAIALEETADEVSSRWQAVLSQFPMVKPLPGKRRFALNRLEGMLQRGAPLQEVQAVFSWVIAAFETLDPLTLRIERLRFEAIARYKALASGKARPGRDGYPPGAVVLTCSGCLSPRLKSDRRCESCGIELDSHPSW